MNKKIIKKTIAKTIIDKKSYIKVADKIKEQIKNVQYKAVLTINLELIQLYRDIGAIINSHAIWGNKFIENLARDIKREFPEATGYSVRNLKYMAQFANIFSKEQIIQTALAQITWYHHITLMDKIKDTAQYLWYVERTVENGWSRNVLVHHIELQLYERQKQSKKVTNFATRLPAPQNALALQTIKDPYIFDFITIKQGMFDRHIENELVRNVTKTLLELGDGFAFVGQQYHLEVSGEDFYIDLLFYNLKLRCYVVIELKTGDFKPEYVGKMNFYLSAVDDLLKMEADQPTIGLLLCKKRNRVIAEYSLRNIEKPIGVSEYRLTKKLPNKWKKLLPDTKDIEKQISHSLTEEKNTPQKQKQNEN
ncbi:MAG: PDDEXK nuclease domain-containing protein [Planctomycetaceae bacterium]|jgi:predicted nuclease of restriction endonuclease-like (RecB) superfamily|nr:PDDEXK nuclease domain-containing protein [Planctomycetaceae bacterium]